MKDVYSKSGNMNKVYVVLYTCTSSRVVHRGLVPKLTSEAFVSSFKRFIATRGVPRLVVSHNRSTFKNETLRSC